MVRGELPTTTTASLASRGSATPRDLGQWLTYAPRPCPCVSGRRCLRAAKSMARAMATSPCSWSDGSLLLLPEEPPMADVSVPAPCRRRRRGRHRGAVGGGPPARARKGLGGVAALIASHVGRRSFRRRDRGGCRRRHRFALAVPPPTASTRRRRVPPHRRRGGEEPWRRLPRDGAAVSSPTMWLKAAGPRSGVITTASVRGVPGTVAACTCPGRSRGGSFGACGPRHRIAREGFVVTDTPRALAPRRGLRR